MTRIVLTARLKLLAFDGEKKKKSPDPLVLWSHVEAIAWFLNGDLFQWYSKCLLPNASFPV